MKSVEKKYMSLPFWSWNDELDTEKLIKQIDWMNENGIGGFFMHARGGLKTPYLGEKWFECVDACAKRAEELGMEAYAYDENGWPSGFVGGKLLEDTENRDMYLTYSVGEYDKDALVSYDISGDKLIRVSAPCEKCLNLYSHCSTSTADILNPEVVQKFLDLTHEEPPAAALRRRHPRKGSGGGPRSAHQIPRAPAPPAADRNGREYRIPQSLSSYHLTKECPRGR